MIKYFISSLLLASCVSFAFAQTVPDDQVDQIDCATITHPLKLGSRDAKTGGDVTTLQTYLAQANFLDSDPTGYFGRATRKAVQSFQSANALSPVGSVGRATRMKIKELSCTTINTTISKNLKTYFNTKYGFGFKYPTNWYPHFQAEGHIMLLKSEKLPNIGATEGYAYGDQIIVDASPIGIWQIGKLVNVSKEEYIQTNFTGTSFVYDSSGTKKWVNINGMDMLRVERMAAGAGNRTLNYLYFKDDKVYSFYLYPYNPNESTVLAKIYEDFQGLVSSFKFTSPILPQTTLKTVDWNSLIPSIRTVLEKAFLWGRLEELSSTSFSQKADITGDGVPEALVKVGMGATTYEYALVRLENGKPTVPLFKQKDGKISTLMFTNGASAAYGSKTEMLGNKNAIYSASYSKYGDSTDYCLVEAYQWNSQAKIFEYNVVLSNEVQQDYCRTAGIDLHSSDKSVKSSLGNCILRPRMPSPDKSNAAIINNPDAVYLNFFPLKFQEGSAIRLRDGKFLSLCGADLTQLNNIIIENPSIQLQRLFTRSEEELTKDYEVAKVNSLDTADLNLWYSIRIQGNTDRQKLQDLIKLFNLFDIVEIAYIEPISSPASLPKL